MIKIGERVGAILSADEEGVKFLGFGLYENDEVPPVEIGGMGAMLGEMGVSNPKIKLDSGKVVWGCECWWAAEAEIQKRLEGHTVIEIDIEAARLES